MKKIKVSDLADKSQYLRVLVYGEPGVGKTWFGASACLDEATSPVLYLDYCGQAASMQANPEYLKAIEEERLVLLELEKYQDLNHVYTWLFTGKFPDGIPTPKTVVVDSVTELQRLEVNRRAGNAPNVFLTDVERPQIQDWGKLLDQFVLLAKVFYALPYHIVFSALEMAQMDDREKVIAARPAFQGQARRLFPAYALTVLHLRRAARNLGVYNVGYTAAVKARSKDQTGCFPAVIPAPTIPMLVRLLAGGSPKSSKGGK
jgi:hypothetical protein